MAENKLDTVKACRDASSEEELVEAKRVLGERIVAALIIRHGLDNVASQLKALGLNNAATSMGAIELLASEVKGVGDNLSTLVDRYDG